MTHSPLPWRRDSHLGILDANLNDVEMREGNMATIVTAVNAHAALVAAMEEMMKVAPIESADEIVAYEKAMAALELARKGGA